MATAFTENVKLDARIVRAMDTNDLELKIISTSTVGWNDCA
jgi:hypothetical protein